MPSRDALETMSRIGALAAYQQRQRCRCPATARYNLKIWAAAVCCLLCSTTTTICVQAMMPSIFLEADVRVAWASLLDEGSKLEGGPGELVGAMLEECHGRRSGGWSAECDRALYLQSVLEKVSNVAAFVQRSVEEEQQLGLDSAAREIVVVPSAQLPFSAFFLEYAVPRRPVIISGEAGDGDDATATAPSATTADKDILSGKEQDLRSHVDSDENAFLQQRTLVDKGLVNNVAACLPYPVDSTAGTVEGPLRACSSSVLDSVPIPFQVTEDFAQRFRSEDVLPVVEHPDVERFLSGWQSLHRTRRGSDTHASACPSGANAIVVVISGTLEVLVYAADDLPHLRPTYGNAPCPRNCPQNGNDDQGGVDFVGDSTREQHAGADAPLSKSDGQSLGSKGKDAGSDPGKSWEETTDGVGRDVEEPASEKAMGRRSLESWPHEPKFCASVWPSDEVGGDDNSTSAVPPRKNVRDLSVGDVLFVPSGAAVAWRAKGIEDEAMVARFCYVDASNFDSVKTQLPIYAAVEAGARGLLRAFSSPVFDTSMSRRPSVVSAADFLAGNRHTPMSVLTSSSSSTTFSPGSSFSAYHSNTDENAKAEADLGAEGVSGRRRLSAEGSMASGVATSGFPDDLSSASSSSSKSTSTSESGTKGTRGRRGRKSFKEWQDDSRWDLKVLGLTLPTLEAPRVKSCERTSCTLEWISSFVKRGQDQTKLGFNLSFVPVAVNASIAGVNGGVGVGVGGGGGYMEVYVGDPNLNSEHALDRELLSLGITEGKRHTVVVNGDLSPDTLYRFSVCIIYGETAGPFSEQSKPVRTGEITPPLALATTPEGSPGTRAVTLRFRAPYDDGGAPVSSYHVMSRPTGGNLLEKWQVIGMAAAPAPRESISVHDTDVGVVSVKVDNLVPGVAYQFRVCAQNDVGTSPWSAPSDPVVVLGAASDTGFLSGFHSGHQHLRLPNVTDASVSYAGATEPPPGEGFDPFEREVHGPTIILDDRAGKVRVNDSAGNIDVWTCHFSPKSFRVKAEVVVAQPADADRELENGRFVRNRVVMVERGSTPIVRKVLNAQRAGALGVLVADDGRCNGTFDQLCVHGSDPPEGWAAHDQPRLWNDVLVPVVLILQDDAERLVAEVGLAAAEAESMAWSSLYDGWQA